MNIRHNQESINNTTIEQQYHNPSQHNKNRQVKNINTPLEQQKNINRTIEQNTPAQKKETFLQYIFRRHINNN